MVLIKNPIKSIILPLAVGSIMFLDGCKEDEPVAPTRTDLLVGDWRLTEIDGYDRTDPDYSYLFKFKSSGDFEFCYEDNTVTPQYLLCYGADNNSKWEWQDANETKILIDNPFGNDGGVEWTIDVTVLDATRLEGTFSQEPGYDAPIKFVKVQ